jgi:nucleotide-binding universal stress UspA family protein
VLRRVLVALDDSPYSETATTLAVEWGSRFGARLIGLAILDTASVLRREFVPMGASSFKKERDEALLADAQQHAMHFLSRFQQRCSEAGVAAETFEEVGDAGECILRQAHQCDLVVLGRETHFHFETQDAPDATLAQVLRNSPRPIVVVPRELPTEKGTGILVAYDGGGQAGRTLQAIQLLGLADGETIHVVSINRDSWKAEGVTDLAARFLESHDIPYQLHTAESKEEPAGIVLDKLRTVRPRLLVMGAHGHHPLRDLFASSVTRAVLRACPVPVVIGS